MQGLAKRITRWLQLPQFFMGVLLFFVIESLWIAFSARYPQAFDEQFHFGLIKIYSHHILPFLSGQPPDANQFGAVAADPSYLYHYIMSFPYRLLAVFVHTEAAQVIILRLCDVALFGSGLVLFRRVLLRARISAALVNASMLLLVFIPIVPQLAAQINYDDLLFPAAALTYLLTFHVVDGLRERRIDGVKILQLLAVCLFASVVKYAYLPIFLAVIAWTAVVAWRSFGGVQPLRVATQKGFGQIARWPLIGLTTLVLIGAILCSQRYVVNVARYGDPIPDCGKVLTVEQCLRYGPWHRNYDDQQQSHAGVSKNPVRYTGEWFYGLYYRLFFAINGDYTNYFPLPLPSIAAIVLALSGLVVMIREGRAIFRGNYHLVFFAVVILSYCGALWFDNYKDFLRTGQPVAINGRYLLPILLPMAAILGRAISLSLRRRPATWKPLLATATLLLFIAGGGVLTFISRSDDSWYWPNPAVKHVNHAAQKVLSPLLIESGGKYY